MDGMKKKSGGRILLGRHVVCRHCLDRNSMLIELPCLALPCLALLTAFVANARTDHTTKTLLLVCCKRMEMKKGIWGESTTSI
jgi:hypothetical protein